MAQKLVRPLAGLFVMASVAAIGGQVLFSRDAVARCLAQGQWAYGNCGSSYSGGGSSGGYNYGAAASAGIALLGILADQAEQQRQNEQNEQIESNNRAIAAENARRAACHRNHQVGAAANSEANAIFDSWDPGGAIPVYERAIAAFSVCGDRKNVAIVRRNLDMARKQYAAIKPDNRVSDAQKKYANQNVYSSPNPFAAPARNSSGSSAKLPWSGRLEDCKSAGELEQKTASWFNVCVWDGKKRAERYQPSIDPQKLTQRAKEQCRTAPANDLAQCVMAAKTRIIMTEDAAIRRECSGAAEKLIECVDIRYVYGPNGHNEAQRYSLRVAIANLPGETRPPSGTVVRGCNAGSPGETCRPYGSESSSGSANATANVQTAASKEQTEAAAYQMAVRDYQNQLFDEVATAAVLAAANMIESNASAEERRSCVTDAFQAVRAQMTGGNPPVSPQCAALVDIARSRLAYYASARVDTGPSPADDPLKLYLSTLNSNSKGPNSGILGPGLLGLTPDERMRAQGECLRAGRPGEECEKAGEGRIP